MKLKILLLIVLFLAVLFAINTAQAGNCSNGFCDANENISNCCVDCGCTGNQTCWGVPGASDDQKSCVDPFCGDGYCDITLDEHSIANEYWKNCCDDCGCHGSDSWEAEKMEGRELLYYTPTDDTCNNGRCDGCNIDLHCDDGNSGTGDECLYNKYLNKSICFNVPVTECKDGDSFCPEGCSIKNDFDCEKKCGDGKCEAPEDCEICYEDCSCGFAEECVDGTCQMRGGYCEIRGKVLGDKFCTGNKWVDQFEIGAECDYDYECSSYFCKDSKCIKPRVDKEARAKYTRIGLLGVAMACLAAYFIIVIKKFWDEKA